MIYNLDKRTFISSDFEEPVLYAPARVDKLHPCNVLKIITAFTDCDRISTHMIKLAEGMKNHSFIKGLKVEIILGMTKSSLSPKKHEDICRLIGFLRKSTEMPDISCRYICNGSEVHSKLYIWEFKDDDGLMLPHYAYCGSLNYTTNAFYRRREIVSQCDALEALFYFNSILPDTIDCFDPDVADKLKKVVNNTANEAEETDNSESQYQKYNAEKPIDTIKISLLKSDGSDTGYGSGLNWGIRPNGTKRNKNQAYIPYNKADKRKGFFPDRLSPSDKNCPMFKVITKDFGSFYMRMAQQGNKGLHSVESNAILGEWIRKRLKVPSGEYITKQMLEDYGKTYVVFRKYADGTYLLDF